MTAPKCRDQRRRPRQSQGRHASPCPPARARSANTTAAVGTSSRGNEGARVAHGSIIFNVSRSPGAPWTSPILPFFQLSLLSSCFLPLSLHPLPILSLPLSSFLFSCLFSSSHSHVTPPHPTPPLLPPCRASGASAIGGIFHTLAAIQTSSCVGRMVSHAGPELYYRHCPHCSETLCPLPHFLWKPQNSCP